MEDIDHLIFHPVEKNCTNGESLFSSLNSIDVIPIDCALWQYASRVLHVLNNQRTPGERVNVILVQVFQRRVLLQFLNIL
jgi:hypothetical protein